MKLRFALLLALCLTPLASAAAPIQEPRAKLSSGAVPILQPDDYLRSHPAPDFWSLLAFYVPQTTDASCSVASITMALNGVRGLPRFAADPIVTQERLLEKVANESWIDATARGGSGVTWAEFEEYLHASFRTYRVPAAIDVWRPGDRSDATLQRLRHILAENEQDAADIIIGVFDQGVLTGDVSMGHVSPLGAYDGKNKRVLVMDVDREWHVPYWVSDELLLDAMLKPGPQDAERGGLFRIRRSEAQVN